MNIWVTTSRRRSARDKDQQQANCALDHFIRGEYLLIHERDSLAALEQYNLALHCQPDHYLSLLASGLTLKGLRRWERPTPC